MRCNVFGIKYKQTKHCFNDLCELWFTLAKWIGLKFPTENKKNACETNRNSICYLWMYPSGIYFFMTWNLWNSFMCLHVNIITYIGFILMINVMIATWITHWSMLNVNNHIKGTKFIIFFFRETNQKSVFPSTNRIS